MSAIFVHIPKTAGTALRSAVTERVGRERFHFDYGTNNTNQTSFQRFIMRMVEQYIMMTNNDIRVVKLLALLWSLKARPIHHSYIYGHFVTAKYLQRSFMGWRKRPGYKYITFVRHPLNRAISQYYYYKQSYAPHDQVLRKFQAANVSLTEFLLDPFFANTMYRYLYGLSINDYDCVGVVEEMSTSLAVLGHVLPEFANLTLLVENRSVTPASDIQSLSPDIIQMFETMHAKDFALYKSACQKLHIMSNHVLTK